VTGPKDPSNPEGEDWGFPEVDPAAPTSFEMPEPEQVVYDTGSDAWWRAQAQAQREAADSEASPPAPEAAATEPLPSPLDRDWFPAELVTPAAVPTEPASTDAVAPSVPEPLPQAEPSEPVFVQNVASEAVADDAPRVAAIPVAAPVRVTRPTPPQPTPPAAPEHSANRPPHEGAPVGPGRALAGAAIALIGVLLGVGALYLFNRSDDKGSPVVASPPRATAPASLSPTAAPTATPTTAASARPTAIPPVVQPTASPAAGIVPVSVLNNSKISGLADRGAARFRAGGWPVKLTGNYRGGNIARTTVYYAPGGLASAQRFAKQFGIPRVAPRFPGLPTTGMTVLLTRDYH
jgi:hypothetical protein